MEKVWIVESTPAIGGDGAGDQTGWGRTSGDGEKIKKTK